MKVSVQASNKPVLRDEVAAVVANPEKSPLREWIAKGFGITGLFGDRANTGCICEGGDRPVISKTERGTANVVTFPG